MLKINRDQFDHLKPKINWSIQHIILYLYTFSEFPEIGT